MAKLTLDIPDALLSRLQESGQPVQATVLRAIEQYIHQQAVPITQTDTWKLMGTLEIGDPDPAFVVGQDENGQPITNYAEQVDGVLY